MKINIVGSGNVATHLGRQLSKSVEILSVYSRNTENAKQLANLLSCGVLEGLEGLPSEADLTIVSVKDDALSEVMAKIPKGIKVVHTSGSVGMDVFKGFDRCGVLYPLQTFSKQKMVEFDGVPVLIEANTLAFESELVELASKFLSKDVRIVNASQRKKIHMAAVFACNFTTQLWAESESILKEDELDLSILLPLIKETISKVEEMGPKAALTGPAKRKDVQIIASHLNKLKGEQKEIYELLTKRILNQ